MEDKETVDQPATRRPLEPLVGPHRWVVTILIEAEDGTADFVRILDLSVTPKCVADVEIHFCDCCSEGVFAISDKCPPSFNVMNNSWDVVVFDDRENERLQTRIEHWVKAGYVEMRRELY